jgi:hypothetical protein
MLEIFHSNLDISNNFNYNMRKNLVYRSWFYFRQGWSVYFAFIFAAANTMVTTYFLAIENMPVLKSVFPSFGIYVVTMLIIGVPLLILVGYVHFRKIPAFTEEADISVTSNPFIYKAYPGWQTEVIFPFYALMGTMMAKISKGEKLDATELKDLDEIQKKIKSLLDGGYVGSNMPSSMNNDKFQKKPDV